MNITDFDNFEVEGVDTRDYPDFCDAFISNADYKGTEATDEQIDWLNDNYPELVNELAYESLL